MQNAMLFTALREFTTGLLNQLLVNLAGQDGQIWLEQFKRFLRRQPCWTALMFIVKEKFVVDIGRNAVVKISYLGDNFKAWFINSVEESLPSCGLTKFTLEESMYDKDIIAKIGGVARAITSISDVYTKMKQQPNGPKSPEGDLLTNGSWNIFYVPQAVTRIDANNFSYTNETGAVISEKVSNPDYLFEVNGQWYVLRAVGVDWGGVGWYVYAFSVGDPDGWGDGGRQVFSRNSVLDPSVTATVQVP